MTISTFFSLPFCQSEDLKKLSHLLKSFDSSSHQQNDGFSYKVTHKQNGNPNQKNEPFAMFRSRRVRTETRLIV